MMRLFLGTVLASVLAAGCGSDRPPPKANAPSAKLHQRMNVSLPNLEGAKVAVPGGQKSVIVAWAPNCEPCKQRVTELVGRSKQLDTYRAKLTLVAVLAESDTNDAAKAALASWGVSQPFLIDREGALKNAGDVQKVPAVLVLAQDGEIAWIAPNDATTDDVMNHSF